MFDCVIVNYNTTLLTNACIRSLKNTGTSCRITVFDSSDEEPLELYEDGVNVIDNTKGQVIDFKKFLDQYPNKKPSSTNWASPRHSKTIDTLFDLFPDGFVHLDSDIIVKRNLDELFNPNYAACASYIPARIVRNKPSLRFPRLHPCVMYINVPMCKEHNIRFFDDRRNMGLTRTPKMDTGCSFLQDIEKNHLPIKIINAEDYVAHLHMGSWKRETRLIKKFILTNMKYLEGLDEECLDTFSK